MFTLKTIGEESSELLSRLCKETFVQAYKDDHTADDLESYCNDNYSVGAIKGSLCLNNTSTVVAFQESEPAGFYVIKHHQCPVELSGECTELKQIYVLSNYFGGGLGSNLFSNLIEVARTNGSSWVWLCVSDINYRAQAFYNKLGFDEVGKGPTLVVGSDRLSSSIFALNIRTKDA